MSKSQARERLEDELAKLGGRSSGDQVVPNGSVIFEWFVNNRYLPLKEGDWREETAKIKKYLIQADLVDTFRDYRLENFDKVILQAHLNHLAKLHSRDRVLQIRSYMRAIFAEAVDQSFLQKDPARLVKVPQNLREVDKTTLSWEQLRAALEKLDELSLRDWILMKLDMSNALRPSELFPLRWRCLLEEKNILDIQETVYKGKIRPFGKTKGSLTQVPIADVLATEIVEYREECRKKGKDVSPDAFMFPGRFGGPMDSSNYRKRVLHKLAEDLGFLKLNFQVIRDDCHSGQIQGTSQGHPGSYEAQPSGYDDGDLHAVAGEGGAHGDQLNSRRVGGNGHRRTIASALISDAAEQYYGRSGQQGRSAVTREDFAICGQTILGGLAK